MNKQASSIPALDVEDREKRYEEAILLDGSTIQIPAPYTDAAYFSKAEDKWCLDYDHHHFLFVGEIWQEQKVWYLGTAINRRVGKYHIRMIKEDITYDNFFKWDIIINGEIIYNREIFYDFARTLRYSDDETEIKEMIQCIIENREGSLQNLKALCN